MGDAITNGCKAAVKKAFRRHLRMRRLVALSRESDVKAFAISRRTGIPQGVKDALIAGAQAIVNTIIDCIAKEITAKGLGLLNNVPGIKAVGGKLVGEAVNGLRDMLKKAVDEGIKGWDNSWRRGRRNMCNPISAVVDAAKSAGGAIAGAAGAAANAVKDFAGKVAGVASKVGGLVKSAAVKINNLTGGALSQALQDVGCPLLTKGLDYAMTAALASIGWTVGPPACLMDAITNGCKAAVKKAFRRHLRTRLMRRLMLN